MTKAEAKEAFENVMREYASLVDELAAVMGHALLETKYKMITERNDKLDEARKLRDDYHLDVTDEDAKREVAKMEAKFRSHELLYSALVKVLDPQQRAILDVKRAAARREIDYYKSYHGV